MGFALYVHYVYIVFIYILRNKYKINNGNIIQSYMVFCEFIKEVLLFFEHLNNSLFGTQLLSII